jgi:hypothetical protein
MSLQAKPLAEVTRHAIAVLMREIGAADTLRFINQFTTGSGNYTVDRDAFLDDLTLDQILAEIRHGRPANP